MFDFFEKIYCINLDKRTDRWELAKQEFSNLGILDRVERLPAFEVNLFNDSKRNACYGNHLSHASCIINAYFEGYKNVLIFEDDVKFLDNVKEILPKSVEQLPKNWALLYLGVNVERPCYQISDNLAKLTFAYSTHAYSVSLENKELVKKLYDINMDFRTIHNDVSYNNTIIPEYECFSCIPIVAIQHPSYSDIEERFVNYDWMISRFNNQLVKKDVDN